MVIDTFQTIVMAVFCLAVVSERIREDEFVPYAKIKGYLLEKGFNLVL